MWPSLLGCWNTGLSSENGLGGGSTTRGDPFSATDCETGLGFNVLKGSGLCLRAAGDKTGMLESCERNLEKDGTLMFARDVCFLTYPEDEDVGLEVVTGAGESLLREEEVECV